MTAGHVLPASSREFTLRMFEADPSQKEQSRHTLKMDTAVSSETAVSYHITTRTT